jgi:predicted alpha/beta-hydrolase family hydrolase
MATGAIFVCAHGAGGHMGDHSMERVARALEPRGFQVLRFNFPYRAQHSKRPDPMPVLMRCIEETANRARSRSKLFIGGRSMGGRAASMLAADGFACDGLILLAYPLHPAGKPQALRTAHWPRIKAPVLCVNGTRDALCERNLMEKALQDVDWTMHWLEGADHSFKVLKSGGRHEADVDAELGDACERWVSAIRR